MAIRSRNLGSLLKVRFAIRVIIFERRSAFLRALRSSLFTASPAFLGQYQQEDPQFDEADQESP